MKFKDSNQFDFNNDLYLWLVEVLYLHRRCDRALCATAIAKVKCFL
ncbi:hypothetical protein [Argonema antarcticum]|nr:hypothetical protein [Argonema antarcticum]MCL1472325.1 hypothetical protein [Argonema antarcticum A004/B2]